MTLRNIHWFSLVGFLIFFINFFPKLSSPSRAFEYDVHNKIVFEKRPVTYLVEGEPLSVVLMGRYEVQLNGSQLEVSAVIVGDLEEVRKRFPILVKKKLDQQEECGNRISASQMGLSPQGDNVMGFTRIHYERWACFKGEFFGLKGKNKLYEEKASLRVVVIPTIEEDHFPSFRIESRRIQLSRPNRILEQFLEKLLNKVLKPEKPQKLSIEHLAPVVPSEFQPHLKIDSARFQNNQQGHLILNLMGKFSLTSMEALILCRKLFPESRCG